MTDETKRACTTCVLCLEEDFGYSNYTVEGHNLFCLAGLNPEMDDREMEYKVTPELAAILDKALTCERYRFGAPATLDVEQEDVPRNRQLTAADILATTYTDDREAAELLAKRLSPPEN